MTDFNGRFGTVETAKSENTLDFGGIDERAAMQSHRTGEQHEAQVVFHSTEDVDSAVQVALTHSDSPDSGFTNLASATFQPAKAGIIGKMPMPKSHKRYVMAVSGTAMDGLTAYMEPGAGSERY